MSQSTDEDIAIDFGEIRTEQEQQSFFGPWERHGAYAQHDKDDQKQRHKDLCVSLNTILYPFEDHKARQEDEDGLPHHIAPTHIVEVGKVLLHGSQVLALERVAHRLDDVFQRPARHGGIEGKDDEAAQHAHIAHNRPCRLRRKFLESSDGIAL